jgi:hypothetical protein
VKVGELVAGLRLDKSEFLRDLRLLQAQVARGRDVKIGVDVDNDRLERSLGETTRKVRSLGDEWKKVAWGAITADLARTTARATLLTAAITPLVGGVGALASGLAPLVGLLPAAGVGLAALAQGGGVAALALSGLGDAMDALGKAQDGTAESAEKLEEELKKLSPAARAFVRSMAPMIRGFRQLRDTAQRNLLPRLAPAIKSLSGLFPVLNRAVADTSKTLGDLVKRGAEMISTGPFKRDFAALLQANNGLIRSFGNAALDLAHALGNVLHEAIPLAGWLGRLVSGWARNAKEAAKAGRESGGLAAFFREAREAAESLLGILGNLAGLFGGIFKEGLGGGKSLLDMLEGLTEWLETHVPAAIRTAKAALAGLADKLPKFDFSKIGDDLKEDAQGWAGKLIAGVKAGLDKGNWKPLGASLGAGLAGIVGDGVTLLGGILRDVNWVAVGKKAGLGAGQFAVGFLPELFVGLLKAAKEHPMDFVAFLAAIIPAGRIAGILGKVLGKVPILGPLLKGIEGAGKLVEKPVLAVVGFIGRAFTQGFAKHFPGVAGALRERLQLLVIAVGSKAIDLARAGLRMVAGFARAIGSGLGAVVAAGLRIVAGALRPFAGAPGWLVSKGAALIGGFVRGIGGAIGRVASALGRIDDLAKGALAGAAGWLFSAGRALVQGLLNGIGSLAGAVADKARSLAESAKQAIIGVIKPGSPSKVFTAIGRTIPQGLARGIDRDLGLVTRSMGRMGDQLNRTRFPGQASGGPGPAGGGFAQSVTIVQRPGEDPRALADRVSFATQHRLAAGGL